MDLIEMQIATTDNPVDLIEQIASARDWSFDRCGADEITISVKGSWSDYDISLSWVSELEALHLACGFDFKMSARRRAEVIKLLALINEQLWIGHFDLWRSEGIVMYRNGLLLTDGSEATPAQLDAMLAAAIEACERYYQAFQFVIWAGKPAEEALAAVLFEVQGEA